MAVDIERNKNKIKPDKDYCFNIALLTTVYANAESREYSPNNIRRFVVSPDGIATQFHVSACGKSTKVEQFTNKGYVQLCFSDPKYKPVVSALTGAYVCSNVEEIVVCARSDMGLFLGSKESLASIIHKDKSIATDEMLIKALRDRFPRLKAVTVFNNLSLNQLWKVSAKKWGNPEYFCCEDKELSVASTPVVSYINKTDWYKNFRLRRADYVFDSPNGKLANHFVKLISKIDTEARNKQVEESKEKRLSEGLNQLRQSESKAYSIIRAYDLLIKCFKFNQTTVVYPDFNSDVIVRTLSSTLEKFKLDDYYNNISDKFEKCARGSHIVITANNKIDEKDSIAILSKSLNDLSNTLYVRLADLFITELEKCACSHSLAMQVWGSHHHCEFIIPGSLSSKASAVLSECKMTNADCKSFTNSVIFICKTMAVLFISKPCSDEKNYKGLDTEEFWKTKMLGGRR